MFLHTLTHHPQTSLFLWMFSCTLTHPDKNLCFLAYQLLHADTDSVGKDFSHFTDIDSVGKDFSHFTDTDLPCEDLSVFTHTDLLVKTCPFLHTLTYLAKTCLFLPTLTYRVKTILILHTLTYLVKTCLSLHTDLPCEHLSDFLTHTDSLDKDCSHFTDTDLPCEDLSVFTHTLQSRFLQFFLLLVFVLFLLHLGQDDGCTVFRQQLKPQGMGVQNEYITR